MAQTRIVLKEEDKPLIDEIRQATGASSSSDVITMLVRRYGSQFLAWWRSGASPTPSNPQEDPIPLPSATPAIPVSPTDPGEGLEEFPL